MNSEKITAKSKGGRPKSAVRRSEQLAVMCTAVERKMIEFKARKMNLSVSAYLRDAGLKGQVVMKVKTLPKEVLLLTGTLNHVAANLNQIARKRNSNDELDILERAELTEQHKQLKLLATQIKNVFL
jgi:hypothetical protein